MFRCSAQHGKQAKVRTIIAEIDCISFHAKEVGSSANPPASENNEERLFGHWEGEA